jgi:hypothetical protein
MIPAVPTRRTILQLGAAPFLLGTAPLIRGAGPRVVVIGAVAFGGWTALWLARRGAQVTILDARLGADQLGKAEVEDLDAPVLRDEDVLRLEISVDDAFLVGCSKTNRHLDRVIQRPPGRQRRASHPFAKGLAFEQLEITRPM